jgi:hypothetical protein
MCKLFIVAILSQTYEETRALYMPRVCCGMTWNLASCGPDFTFLFVGRLNDQHTGGISNPFQNQSPRTRDYF